MQSRPRPFPAVRKVALSTPKPTASIMVSAREQKRLDRELARVEREHARAAKALRKQEREATRARRASRQSTASVVAGPAAASVAAGAAASVAAEAAASVAAEAASVASVAPWYAAAPGTPGTEAAASEAAGSVMGDLFPADAAGGEPADPLAAPVEDAASAALVAAASVAAASVAAASVAAGEPAASVAAGEPAASDAPREPAASVAASPQLRRAYRSPPTILRPPGSWEAPQGTEVDETPAELPEQLVPVEQAEGEVLPEANQHGVLEPEAKHPEPVKRPAPADSDAKAAKRPHAEVMDAEVVDVEGLASASGVTEKQKVLLMSTFELMKEPGMLEIFRGMVLGMQGNAGTSSAMAPSMAPDTHGGNGHGAAAASVADPCRAAAASVADPCGAGTDDGHGAAAGPLAASVAHPCEVGEAVTAAAGAPAASVPAVTAAAGALAASVPPCEAVTAAAGAPAASVPAVTAAAGALAASVPPCEAVTAAAGPLAASVAPCEEVMAASVAACGNSTSIAALAVPPSTGRRPSFDEHGPGHAMVATPPGLASPTSAAASVASEGLPMQAASVALAASVAGPGEVSDGEFGVPTYQLAAADRVAIMNHHGPYAALEHALKRRLNGGMLRSATGRVLALWNDAAKDPSGALKLHFLKNWAADPRMGWLRIIERQRHATRQEAHGVWEYKMYSQVLADHGGNERVAKRLCEMAPRTLRHPQDETDDELMLYLVFRHIKLRKSEIAEQSRELELETTAKDEDAVQFGMASVVPGQIAAAIPAPSQYGRPAKAAAKKEASVSKRAKVELSAVDKELDAHKRRAQTMLNKLEQARRVVPRDPQHGLDWHIHQMMDQIGPKVESIKARAVEALGQCSDKEAIERDLADSLRRLEQDYKTCCQRQANLVAATKASARTKQKPRGGASVPSPSVASVTGGGWGASVPSPLVASVTNPHGHAAVRGAPVPGVSPDGASPMSLC